VPYSTIGYWVKYTGQFILIKAYVAGMREYLGSAVMSWATANVVHARVGLGADTIPVGQPTSPIRLSLTRLQIHDNLCSGSMSRARLRNLVGSLHLTAVPRQLVHQTGGPLFPCWLV
jgi:hypothetical protein